MKIFAFTVRPSEKTSRTIEELAELTGVTKNKLISGILEESQGQMQEMVNLLKAVNETSVNGYSTLHDNIKKVIVDASKQNDDIVDKMTNKKG